MKPTTLEIPHLDAYEIYDISPVISERLAVWPGDQEFSRNVSLSFDQGHNLTLSSIKSTVHLGSHTDAPNHYHPKGSGIESRDLKLYLGHCQVIDVESPRGERILPSHLKQEINSKRILLKTNSYPNPEQWNDDFNALSAELVHELSQKGVCLIGIDTPSVDLMDDKDLICHNLIYDNDMAILEGIILKDVDAGEYQLISLPLKLKGVDASPVRSILLKVKV